MESTNGEIHFPMFLQNQDNGSVIKVAGYYKYSMVKVQRTERMKYYSLMIIEGCSERETESVLRDPAFKVCTEQDYLQVVAAYAKNGHAILKSLTEKKS